MCTVGAVLSTAVSGGGQIMSFFGQDQAAKAENKIRNQRYQAISKSAIESYTRGAAAIGERIEQETQATSQALQESQRTAEAGRGTTKVVTAGRGIGGTSVGELLSDFSRIEGEQAYTLETNLKWRKNQYATEIEGLKAGAEQRIFAAVPEVIPSPSPLALGVNLGSSVLNGFSMATAQLPAGSQPTWFDFMNKPIF